jgi:hypothetical protein
MKLLRGTLLIAAFICFVLAMFFEGPFQALRISSGAARPNFLTMGLALWVLSEIVT